MKDVKSEPNAVLNGVKAVVFDLDGTFYNRHGMARRMIRRLWWCLPLMAADRLAKGGPVWRWMVSTRWHKDVYLATMTELIGQTCPRREETVALLHACKASGLKTAVYSDYGAVKEKLTVLGIDPNQFDLLITAPELGGLKPSATCARTVLERLGATPDTTLFVGDRDEKDGAAARSVGARFFKILD